MTDSPAQPEDPSDTGAPAGMPRWVKVFVVLALIAVVLLVVGLLVGGNHGPGRHAAGDGGPTARAGLIDSRGADGREPPAGRTP
jgi:hypothetical protein